MSTAYGFEPVFRTTKCTAQPRRALYLVILIPESLTLTPIVTCTAGAVVAVADGSSASAATEPTANRMNNRVLIDDLVYIVTGTVGTTARGYRTEGGAAAAPPPPVARRYLTMKFPAIPSSAWRGTVQTKRNLPAFENTTL